jgi:hypothetical protein
LYSNIYEIYKERASVSLSVSTQISIKPYSNNERIIDFIIYIGKFLSIINLAMSLINLVIRPLAEILTKYSLSAVFSKIKSAIFDMFISTPYYSTLKSTYYKEGLFALLDRLVLDTKYFIIYNGFYILYFCLFCVHSVYIDFISLPFFLLSIRVICLFLCVVCVYKFRALFKNNVILLMCLAIPLALLGLELHNIYH